MESQAPELTREQLGQRSRKDLVDTIMGQVVVIDSLREQVRALWLDKREIVTNENARRREAVDKIDELETKVLELQNAIRLENEHDELTAQQWRDEIIRLKRQLTEANATIVLAQHYAAVGSKEAIILDNYDGSNDNVTELERMLRVGHIDWPEHLHDAWRAK